jgi:hypothetical protein
MTQQEGFQLEEAGRPPYQPNTHESFSVSEVATGWEDGTVAKKGSRRTLDSGPVLQHTTITTDLISLGIMARVIQGEDGRWIY